MMNKLLIILFVAAQTNFLFAGDLWTKVSVQQLENKLKVNRSSTPRTANYFELDLDVLKLQLQNAPERWAGTSNDLIIQFPNSKGTLESYKVVHSSIMHPDLSAKYPMIKTYAAQGIEDPTAFMRFSVTQFGLHTMSLSGKRSTEYIDPFTLDRKYYIVYDKNSLGSDPQGFECLMDENMHLPTLENDRKEFGIPKAVNDSKLRKFRLAQSCTAEYGNIFATSSGTELADIQAQMTITINRVNTVYEIDLGIELEFVANNDLIIYFGSTTADPWNGEWNTTTAQTIDAIIGVSNYDIGHNFNTQGGGNAGCLSCVCLSTSQTGTHKGRAYTGRANPTGDPFDIDYVAHEMGHQLGGWHVMNTCSRSGSGATEVEPASGSSIMGYAGICGTNVQSNSDAHFNYVNIRDISANIKPGGNSTCANEITTTNNPPTANAGLNYIIPRSTAFVLEGTASDIDGMASLTYNWSQNDPEEAPTTAAPQSTWTVGPMYRSILPTTSPNRYMPNIASVIAGNLTPTWEVTPSVGRNMEFAFMVRDNDILGGQTADDLMQVTVNGSAGPFQVTSQNTNQNWIAGQSQTVTWNVAGTDAGPVNTPNVDIFLSLDGGFTYPVTLASNVPNDGSHSISIPGTGVTNNGKIMVRGHNNIFYALNGANISIIPGDFFLDFASTVGISCIPNDIVYNFTYNPLSGFSENTVFSISNLPAGIIATFNPVSASSMTAVTLTLSNITSANIGIETLDLNAVATSSSQVQNLSLEVADIPNAPVLNTPMDNETDISLNAFLEWTAEIGSNITYDVEVSTDIAFSNIISNGTGLITNNFTTSLLETGEIYFWRVRTINPCGTSMYSSVFNFITTNCFITTSADVPVAIPNNSTVTSDLVISESGVITDLNVVDVIGDHNRVGQLTVTLTSPSGTSVVLWSNICGNDNDFILNFDDDAASSTIPCPPTTNGFYQPDDLLSAFNGENSQGTWVLSIEDNSAPTTGDLENWALDICLSTIPCLDPDVPTIMASETIICSGNSTSLSIASGNLNDATQWQWYEATCGGAMLGTGPNLTVSATSSETYLVRGEGGCIFNPQACAEVDITVNEIYVINNAVTETDSAFINGFWYDSSQFIVDVLTTVNGCDSIIKTTLTIEKSQEVPSSISELLYEDALLVYPNPSNGMFVVEFEKQFISKTNELIIYNVLGQKIYELSNISTKKMNIDLSNQANGVYHIFYKDENYILKKDLLVK